MRRLAGAFAAALGLAGCAAIPHAQPGPSIAITIDDLPVHGPIPPGTTANAVNLHMIKALRQAQVPGVHAFINGQSVALEPETFAALQAWRAAGVPLANHGWAHRNLNDLSVEEFEGEVARNEPLLQRLGLEQDWRWFRFPFLAEGDDWQKRLAARAVLARRGYRIAGVSMDFSDWKWPAPYQRCLAIGDRAAIAELEQLYLDAARANLEARRELGRTLYGRDIPHVLLLHVSAFSARMMPRLLYLYRRAGVGFISLEQAHADPAYAEDIDLRLPPRSPFIGARAAQRGLPIPPEPNYDARLATICGGAPSEPPQ